MSTPFYDITDAIDVAIDGDAVDEYLYQTTEDYLYLSHVPKVSDSGSNQWVDLTTTSAYFTAIQVFDAGEWKDLSLVTSLPVGELEGYLHISARPLSNRIYVHANHQGKQFRAQYTGIGSLISAQIVLKLQEAVNRLEDGYWLAPFSTNQYSSGRWDGSEDDDENIWLSPSLEKLRTTEGDRVSFPGMTIDFGGDIDVLAFTNANFWKRILIGIQYNAVGSNWYLYTLESVEAATQAALVDPEPDDPRRQWCCTVDVQNNGTTGADNEIVQAIAQEHLAVYHEIEYHDPIPIRLDYNGILITGQDFAQVSSLGVNWRLVMFVLMCGTENGSSGETRLDLRIHNQGGGVFGSEIITDNADMPKILFSDPDFKVDITPQGDFLANRIDFGPTDSLRIAIDEAASGAANMSAVVWAQLEKFKYT